MQCPIMDGQPYKTTQVKKWAGSGSVLPLVGQISWVPGDFEGGIDWVVLQALSLEAKWTLCKITMGTKSYE